MRSIIASTENSYSLAFSCVYVYDGNGNVTEYIDAEGAVQAHYEYGPFGEISASSGDKRNDFAHRFSTKPYEEIYGLVRYELRDYSPELGRWMSRDPIGEEGHERTIRRTYDATSTLLRQNISKFAKKDYYSAMNNDPINLIDLIGKSIWGQDYFGIGHAYYLAQRNGVSEVTVAKKCQIVVLVDHGIGTNLDNDDMLSYGVEGKPVPLENTKAHIFVFQSQCTAGGFVGCVSVATNMRIHKKNRIDGLNLDPNTNYILSQNLRRDLNNPNDHWFFGWSKKAEDGAKKKAEEFCATESCCCKKVEVRFIQRFAWNAPGKPDSYTYKCPRK